MGLDYNALVDNLSSQPGILGVLVTQTDGTVLAQKNVTDGECALVAFAGDAVRESCNAFAMGDVDNLVIVGSDYKLLMVPDDNAFIGVFTGESKEVESIISLIR